MIAKFTDTFVSARNVGTPLIKVNTSDNTSTIQAVRQVLGKEGGNNPSVSIPLARWDAINGLVGLNDNGGKAVVKMLSDAKLEQEATCQLPLALKAMDRCIKNFIVFISNPHLFWDNDPLIIQGIWNLRDLYKANGMMVVCLTELGTVLPSTLNNDVLSIEDLLPTRADIRKIVLDTYSAANKPNPSEEILEAAGDALVGLPFFPAEQATAMELNMKTGMLNVKGLWARKKTIISATPGLSFYDDTLTLDDMGGGLNIKSYGSAIMKGKRKANIILRVDEIEKAFAGAGTDTSGVKGDLLGNFLSWVEDKKVFCILLLGVPGASKSHFIYCLGGTFGKPVINFDIAGMQDSLVGNSGKNLRKAEATVEAISDGQIILIATANSLNGLPAELLSRFEKGGIFFFDVPEETERQEIIDLKIAKYKLKPEQTKGFDVTMTEGWTGREIDSLCDKADRLETTLVQAAEFVVPITQSQKRIIDELRTQATGRYLSSSKPGRYQFTPTITTVDHTPTMAVTPPSGKRMMR